MKGSSTEMTGNESEEQPGPVASQQLLKVEMERELLD